MAREDTVDDKRKSGFPKARLTAALTGLVFTAMGFIAEKLFRSMLETALSVVAGISILLLLSVFFAFFGAWEYREDQHEEKISVLRMQVNEMHEDYLIQSQSSEFSHQSLLVGLSARHINELQEQRKYYEDYIAAVVYVLDASLVRLGQAEASVLPIIKGLMNSPLYQEQLKNNEDLKKWTNFLNSIRDNQIKQD